MSDKEVEVGEEAITSTDVGTIRPPPPPEEDDTDDGSSIEVLNWSDFSEDEMEAARLATAREYPLDGTNNVAAEAVVPEESESIVDSSLMVESQESTDSVATVQDKIEDAMSGLSSKSSSQGDEEEEEEFQNLEYPVGGDDAEDDDEDTEKDAETEKIQDEDVFGSMLSINSNISKEGSSSNLPVLDDGPIWGKGEKLYRFHENRTINQKLTFGVLISVVLAVGIGLGNLVAYQEYEGEQHHHHHHHESSKIEQHFHHCPASRLPLTQNTNDHHVPVVPNGFPSSTRISDQASPSDDLIKQRTSTQDRYTIQNDALAYVVKSLDELSKKLEHFENTTRQLSGIIVMSDEARLASHNTGRKSAENPEELSDDLSSWDVPSDRPLTFSQVVHSDQEIPQQVEQRPLSKAELPVFHVPDHLNVLSTDEEPSEATLAAMRESISPKSRHSKSEKRRREADSFVPEHVHQVQRKSKKDKHSHKLDRPQPGPLIPSSPQEQKMERPEKMEKIKRKVRSIPREEFKLERSPPEEEFRRRRSAPQEDLKREWSPPQEYKRERSPPSRGQRERSPPRDDLRREGSPSRKQNKKRENPPPRHDWNRPIPPPAHQKRHGKNGMENYPPHVIYLPENNYSNFEVKQVEKKWTKNEYENSFDFEPSKSKRKHKYDDRVIIDNPNRGNEFPTGTFPDWDLERAKLRESQRIQSNWDKDFRASQRKRQQNWQIERDRVREKVRSKGL